MSTPKRFYNGISSVVSDNPLGALPYLDPTTWAVYFEDFLQYDKTQGNAAWTLTQTNTADAIVGPTGVVTLTTSGNDNDLGQLYHTDAPFQLTSGKKAIIEIKAKVTKGGGTIGQEELVLGLTSVQTGADFMAADGLSHAFDDGICFISYDGSANINCIQGENDVFSSELGASTLVDDTWAVYSIYFDGTTSYFYKDDLLIASLSTNPPTSVLTPMLFIKEGEAQTRVLSVDYVLVAIER